MREAEIRQVLSEVCQRLDRSVASLSAASAVVGASLLVGSGCGGDTIEPSDGGVDAADSGAQPVYAAPVDGGLDQGPVIHYGIVAPDAGTDVDPGPVPEYMVQPVDAEIPAIYNAPPPR